MGQAHVMRYDESALARRLADVPQAGRAAFAAAIAERLFALYAGYAAVTGGATQELREALDAAWDAIASGARRSALEHSREVAEALVPDEEDEGWVAESAYGQNGATAVAYALRTQLSDDPQEAIWGARQLYEAADYAAQQQNADLELNEPGADELLLCTPVVQEALAGIEHDLARVAAGEDVTSIRQQAQDGAHRLAGLVLSPDSRPQAG